MSSERTLINGGRKLVGVRLADIISYAFSAPFFALLSLIIIYIADSTAYSPLSGYIAILIGGFFLTVLPAAPIVLNVIKGDVDVFISDRKRRPKFYLYALLSYLVGAFISYISKVKVLIIIHLAYFFVTLSVMLITFKTKISAHTSGITGPVTYIVYFLGPMYTVLYLITIPVAWARIKLEAHTPQQTISGAIIAIVITFLTCYFITRVLT